MDEALDHIGYRIPSGIVRHLDIVCRFSSVIFIRAGERNPWLCPICKCMLNETEYVYPPPPEHCAILSLELFRNAERGLISITEIFINCAKTFIMSTCMCSLIQAMFVEKSFEK